MNTPDFHQALIQMFKTQPPEVKVSVLSGLYQRNVLDLDIENDKGLRFLDALCLSESLHPDIIDFINHIGRPDLYAQPHYGKWIIADQQIRWSKEYIGSPLPRSQTLSKIIDQVNEQYWLQKDKPNADPGSTLMYILGKLPHETHLPLVSLWKRGVHPEARLSSSWLAAASIHLHHTVNAYQEAGGNLEADAFFPSYHKDTYPLWRHIYEKNTNLVSTFSALADSQTISKSLFEIDQYGKEVVNVSGNHSEMVKKIIQRSDWNTLKRYNNDPFWLYTLQTRPELFETYIERKRKRPNFKEQDHLGRSVWFWANTTGYQDQNTFHLLHQEAPDEDLIYDHKGQGLGVQLLQFWVNQKTSIDYATIPYSSLSHDQLWSKVDQLPIQQQYKKSIEENQFKLTSSNNTDNLYEAWLLHLALHCKPTDRLTPEQRGYLAASIVLHSGFASYGKMSRLTELVKETGVECLQQLTHQSIVWPEPSIELIEKRKINSYPFDQEKINFYLNQWESIYQKQKLEKEMHRTSSSAPSLTTRRL